jgi:hypothetical protein
MPATKRGLKFRESFATEVLDYLMLELGESSKSRGALRLKDLEYLGEHLHEGVLTHFWSYPWGRRRSWATVQPSGRTYVISTCTTPPGAKRDAEPAEIDVNWPRESREDREYRRLLDRANKWQQSQLKRLRARPFAELAKLPARSKLDPPDNLNRFDSFGWSVHFIISRQEADRGAVLVAVQRVFGGPGVDESRQGPWFEMLPNGRIVDEA